MHRATKRRQWILRSRYLRPALVGAVVGIIVGAGIPVALAGTASGSWGYYGPTGGYTYRNQNTIYTKSSGSPLGAWAMTYAETSPSGQGNVPTGWIGVLARMYNSSDALIRSNGYRYNDQPVAGMSTLTSPYTGAHSAYKSWGLTRAWNGSSYYTYGSFQSPYQNW